jgi:membrane-associated PAP2 superfamily phosphatase
MCQRAYFTVLKTVSNNNDCPWNITSFGGVLCTAGSLMKAEEPETRLFLVYFL